MKIVIPLIWISLLAHISTVAQPEASPIKTALLIVDIQQFYFPGDGPGLVGAEAASLKAKSVLERFRAKHQVVVHIRHQSAKGFDIHPNVAPVDGEKVITKNQVNSFHQTDLLEYLKINKITRLVIIGMQTHMCLEAAVRAAHDFGFECVVVQDACATRDLKYADQLVKALDVHNSTLATLVGGGYCKVVDEKNFGDQMDTLLFHPLD